MQRCPVTLLAAMVGLLLMMAGAAHPCARHVPLTGTYWRAVAIDGNPVAPQPEKRQAHLVFNREGSRVSGSTGCNRITGTFTDTSCRACASPRWPPPR